MADVRSKLPRYGPYHRRCSDDPAFIDLVVSTRELRGRRRRNVYAGAFPCVKDVAPDPETPPVWPQWSDGRPGVRSSRDNLNNVSEEPIG